MFVRCDQWVEWGDFRLQGIGPVKGKWVGEEIVYDWLVECYEWWVD